MLDINLLYHPPVSSHLKLHSNSHNVSRIHYIFISDVRLYIFLIYLKQIIPNTSLENLGTDHFAHMSGHLKRVKRDWVIPPLNLPENDRGPFPKYIVKIKTSKDSNVEINYRITGPGADEPPVGLFTIDRRSGVLQVTQLLDREQRDKYKLWVHAIHAHDGNKAEEPMELIIHIVDMNDNRPEFTPSSFYGQISESARAGDSVMRVMATDRDDPETDHAMIKYRILSQSPEVPSDYIFAINPLSGVISLTGGGLDRETHSEYYLVIHAADMNGEGLSATCTVTITITDSNDNAPQFLIKSVAEVIRLKVTDEDELGSANTNTKYSIIKGNEGAHFKISTSPDKMEGILSTAKKLDFESTSVFTLLIIVTNEAPFTRPVSTSTATITVTVEDKNEPPMFSPSRIQVALSEDAPIGSSVTYLRAVDPDTARTTKIRYLNADAAGWFNLDQDTGRVSVRSDLDRESHFVRDNMYTVPVLAYDNDTAPATGTGTLIVTLVDVNDNAPVIQQRRVSVCNVDPVPVQLDIVDSDSPENAAPFTVELQGEHSKSWNIKVNKCCLFTMKSLKTIFSIYLCHSGEGEGGSFIVLSFAVLLLLLILRRRKKHMDHVALLKDPSRDNIFCYDEEGGGEEDRDFDPSLLHRGLNERHEVLCSDVVPVNQTRPSYRHHPQPNEDIGHFLTENLVAADGDSTAPPYDSLLVFDYEGAGSEAESLSSLDSSSDSELDQDFGALQDWGPRFSRLADMYTEGMEDDNDTLPGKTEWV
uniref:Cadherin-1 n=1 Tax=Periophthalmus magnuspinnatus TaxID=409849 RepID=A0A3B4AGF7_9GOBI